MTRVEGTIERLVIEPAADDAPARYRLAFRDGASLPLNEALGQGLTFRFDGQVSCRHCERPGRRSFGNGYCYECFTTLARCDLCVVSPDRCHYHLGTCREPEWGEAFCMQPHTVYLANSSGIKVGITRRGREVARWLDQGAIQGLPIVETPTRQVAGLIEVRIAVLLGDRTDWRRMLRGDVPELALDEVLARLREQPLPLPEGASWCAGQPVTCLRYPLPADVVATQVHKLPPADTVSGNLLGLKGQYLVLDSGALNVGQLIGYGASVELGRKLAEPPGAQRQLGLF